MPTGARSALQRPATGPPSHRLVAVVTLLALAFTLRSAWVAEDAFITFRAAYMLRDGFGPVFNAGRRVDVFTSPLWMGVQSLIAALRLDPFYWSIALGLALTAAFFLLAAHLLTRRTAGGEAPSAGSPGRPSAAVDPPRPHGAAAFVALAMVLLSSDTFDAFQTSGMETAALTLLIAGWLIWVEHQSSAPAPRAIATGSLLASLLMLARPDMIFLCTPLLAYMLVGAAPWRRVGAIALGQVPLMAWEAFSVVYYGQLVPNTAVTKVGMYGTLWLSAHQGLVYVADYAQHEPLQVLAIAAGLAAAALQARRERTWRANARLALVGGILVFLAYLIAIGGDYMRGRFLDPVLVGATLLGAVALADAPTLRPTVGSLAALGLIAFGVYGVRTARIRSEAVILPDGIVNERIFWHTTLSLWARVGGTLARPGADVAAYAARYGPITVSNATIGQFGYYAGPQVTVLDPYGISDPFIARMPVAPHSRIGHPLHLVPPAYDASQHAVSDLPDYPARIAAMDPTLRSQALAQPVVWRSTAARRTAREMRVLSQGPLWTRARWRLILGNLVPLRL